MMADVGGRRLLLDCGTAEIDIDGVLVISRRTPV
jgi:hypothetical protein